MEAALSSSEAYEKNNLSLFAGVDNLNKTNMNSVTYLIKMKPFYNNNNKKSVNLGRGNYTQTLPL